MIDNHNYDAGWPRDDSEGCRAIDPESGTVCGKPRSEHQFSAYEKEQGE